MTGSVDRLQIDQSNVYYNYAVGLVSTQIDLLKTAGNLLKSGTTHAVCFSDLKVLYIDDNGEVQLDWIMPNGRQWDTSWRVKFSESLPQSAMRELIYTAEFVFHEQRIEGYESKQLAPYLRAALPPFILETDDLTLPIYAWVKIFSDGVFILSFQLDTVWDGLDEEQWISKIANLPQCYFDSVWVNEQIQRLDAEQLLPLSFQKEVSIAGQSLRGIASKKLLKKLRRKSRAVLQEALNKEGREFEIGDEHWILHEVAGTEHQGDWEATSDLCRSLYTNALASLIVSQSTRKAVGYQGISLWEGRPSVSLMRFRNQPSTKKALISRFGPSMSRILMRSAHLEDPRELPPDLRIFGDYCLHGNRSLLLWTWLRSENEPDDAWENHNTRTTLIENQARAEHFEYHNMRVARACMITGSPLSYRQLAEAYESLVSAEDIIHRSSQAGEITDALSYLMSAVGTVGLVPSGKERARWRLDEFRYCSELQRTRLDRWIAFMFGLVGASGLADLVFKPYLTSSTLGLNTWEIGLISFVLAVLAIVFLAIPIWFLNKQGASGSA